METLTVPSEIKAYVEEILNDYRLACLSREVSLLGRKEVLTGKAKFGIFGDGKELAQIAMAKQFRPGDWRSGYYRDQTFMMAIGALDVKQYFAGLYAHPDKDKEPFAGGRQMGGHFATTTVGEDGEFLNLAELKNSSADISPTAGQMPRLLGLAFASKLFRQNKDLHSYTRLSDHGNEVAFGTIGDASTSEGLFWETMNAAGVLQVPMVMNVWDDGYGISVSREHQTVKNSISKALSGFKRDAESPGYEFYEVKGWDYGALITTYEKAVQLSREEHIPVLIHVTEVTQPQGHSTSGSHERYKDKERLAWETEFDCIEKFKSWIAEFRYQGEPISTLEELDAIRAEVKKEVKALQKDAWKEYLDSIKAELNQALELIHGVAGQSEHSDALNNWAESLSTAMDPIRKDIISTLRKVIVRTAGENSTERQALISWYEAQIKENEERYSSQLYNDGGGSVSNVPEVSPELSPNEEVDGRIILRDNFDAWFAKEPLLVTFGEDTGKIGGVNQSMEGMQEKYGELRVMDTGIREATIVGQGIGMAMRGLKPLAEIQYLDYLYYALQIMSDDLATVRYRTVGQQKAPLIIRTRGHRLEGIWHSGSPMGAIVNSIRGVMVCVPRNMTQAAGMLNTLLNSDEPALIVEPLNGYRTKERKVLNPGEFTIPLGKAEVLEHGSDLTLVSYGSTLNLCVKACEELSTLGIDVELIDVQTLIPFDLDGVIGSSVKKTNRLMVVDEDVPGGASAYILERALSQQGIFFHLDSEPKVMSAKDHRPAYGTDGDYFSKPSIEDIVEGVYQVMSEADPERFPALR